MKVFASMRDESNQGWVWLSNGALPPRSIVKLTNKDTDNSVYCETLQIDDNFLNEYNKCRRHQIHDPAQSVVLNGWYRAKLGGVRTQVDVRIEVSPANGPRGKFLACSDHPQTVVRMAAWLGFISVALGFFGIILGMIGLILSFESP